MTSQEPFAGTTILVTGGAGFVGSNLVRALLSVPVRTIHVVDNLLSSERISVPADHRIRFSEGSIGDDRVLALLRDEYDYVFHLCTFHGNQNSIHDPLADHEHNQLTTLKLFERMKAARRLRRLVYAGAGCAVAEKTVALADATEEDAPVSLHADSPYAISKIVGEFYSVYYHARHGLPVVRTRFQNVYGPGEILGAGRWRGTPATVWRNVVPTFVYKAIQKEPLPLEGGGNATRDFVYVADIVRGLFLAAARGSPGDVYNLASGVETSILDLASIVSELTGNPTPPRILAKRDWDSSGRRFGSTTKAQSELGFRARVSLREGLMGTVQWTRENLSFIETCIQKHASEMTRFQNLEPTVMHRGH